MEPATAISLKDVADLLFAARGRIDFYWNFHVVVVIAVIGWLVTHKQRLTVPVKILVSLVYLIAAAANFAGLYGSYTFAEALRNDLLRMAASSALTETRLLLEQHSYLAHRSAAFWIHFVLAIAILLVVWFARLADVEVPAVAKKARPKL